MGCYWGWQLMINAIAIIKSGRSFDEASKVTGIPVGDLIAEWNLKSGVGVTAIGATGEQDLKPYLLQKED